MTLFELRVKFTRLIVVLLGKMIADGYQPLIGRDGEKHMKNSLHYDGLAMDIILTKDGKILDKTEDHYDFGVFWETLDIDCFWGGNGIKPDGLKYDGNHYSVTYQGKK